jgi:hypothetical protein
MNDLEQRLREDLSALADAVPPSTGGWAEHRRRVTDRHRQKWRGPALAAAVTTVLAGAAVGGPLLLRGEPTAPGSGTGIPVSPTIPVTPMPPPQQGAPEVSPVPTSPGPPPSPADTRPPGPMPTGMNVTVTPTELARFTEDGVGWIARAHTEQRPDGAEWLCIVGVPVDGPEREHPNSSCSVPFDWPHGQPQHLVDTRPVLAEPRLIDSGPLVRLMLFVTKPNVDRVVVRDGSGDEVPVREVGRDATLTLYLADFGGSSQGFGYTAYDGAGRAVESAIT